jgi:hypothetical protein
MLGTLPGQLERQLRGECALPVKPWLDEGLALHCAKTSIERKETVWATFRCACDDGATAVSTPMRRSLGKTRKARTWHMH